jgi:hypothetical protein
MYIKLTNGVPVNYSIGQLRRDNPQVSFPKIIPDATLAEYGVYPLTATEQPSYDPIMQSVAEGTAVLVDGVWTQVWTVSDATPEEVAERLAQLQRRIANDTQRHLDNFARTRNYDGMLSLCTYATSTNPKFAAEGQYGVEARDATWDKLYEMLAEVEAGTRPIPSGFSDILPELPALFWPV